MTWGPWVPGLDTAELRARLRILQALVKVLAGPRGDDCRHALLLARLDPASDTLAEARRQFDRLGSIDQRRILSSYAEVA